MAKKQKVRFLVNPKSGGFFGARFNERMVKKHLDLNKFDYDIHVTQFAGHAIKLAQQSLIEKIDIIAVVGGDGTQNEVGQVIMNTPIKLASIPTGSGNANARKLQIPINIAHAIELINTGKVFKIDACLVNHQPFFMTAGLGYDGKVIQRFNQLKIRGVGAYVTSVLTTAFTYDLPTYTITLDDDKVIETKAFTILMTSTGQLGYDVEFSHKSILNDGIFEICIVKDFNRMRVPSMIQEAFFGDIASLDILERHACKKASIKSNTIENLQMDGDYKGSTNYIEVSIQKEALQFIVSKNFKL